MIIIGRIVINPLIRIAAGSVDCNFIFPISNFTAAPLLVDGTSDMKELADTIDF